MKSIQLIVILKGENFYNLFYDIISPQLRLIRGLYTGKEDYLNIFSGKITHLSDIKDVPSRALELPSTMICKSIVHYYVFGYF